MLADHAKSSSSNDSPLRQAPSSRVSVITVCRNAAETIDLTLDSVAQQSYPLVEHLVVDGASTDGTAGRVAAHRAVRLISEPDHGIYDAMEKGARLASGDIVYFLNSGDVFHDRDVLAQVVAFFDTHDCDAVFGNLRPCYLGPGDTHDHPAFRAGRTIDFSYFCNRRLFFDECVHHQATFYRKAIFSSCGFRSTDPRATGEYHLNVCAFVRDGRTFKHIPRTVCDFALGGRSTSDFDAEWSRFATARDLLRQQYFSEGRSIRIDDPYEFLVSAPPPSLRLKVWLRRLPLHGPLARLRRFSARWLP